MVLVAKNSLKRYQAKIYIKTEGKNRRMNKIFIDLCVRGKRACSTHHLGLFGKNDRRADLDFVMHTNLPNRGYRNMGVTLFSELGFRIVPQGALHIRNTGGGVNPTNLQATQKYHFFTATQKYQLILCLAVACWPALFAYLGI